jgi:hypothetical protein
MNLNEIKPIGPHIEGFIRFAHEGEGDTMRQLDHFEVLSRVHEVGAALSPKFKAHPLSEGLVALDLNKPASVIKVIPIRLLFDKPENNLSARYEAYDNDLGRKTCSGDGKDATRKDLKTGKASSCECAGPDACDYANSGEVHCHLNVRLKVQIDNQQDPFAVFELQSGSINTYRTLSAKLQMMHATFEKKLRHIPLNLTVWEKSSKLSNYEPFYCADLKLPADLTVEAAMTGAKNGAEQDLQSGLAIGDMEKAVEQMIENGDVFVEDDSPIITFTPPTSSRRATRPAPMAAGRSISDIIASATGKATANDAIPPVTGLPKDATPEAAALIRRVKEIVETPPIQF